MPKQNQKVIWNSRRDLWESEDLETLEPLGVFSETLPKWGMTRGGQLYALAMWERPINAPVCSLSPLPLLRTPDANEGSRGPAKTLGGRRPSGSVKQISLTDQIHHLPTPNASDSKRNNGPSEATRNSPGLTAVSVLFPTPNTMEHLPVRYGEAREKALHRGDMTSSRRASTGNLREEVVHETVPGQFGKYGPAVQRWEKITGTTAPSPTSTNTKGKPQLNAAFAEWIMGIPAGHVTDTPGIPRTKQLKAIGNGVCPPQAVAALESLLEGLEW